MKKLLVTTDFSENSKAAIRFAIQIASQADVALTFLHVLQLGRPTTWHESTYLTYEKEEVDKDDLVLGKFIDALYAELQVSLSTYTCAIEVAPVADCVIMGYAEEHGFDYICISTRGAGTFEKIIGTTTSNLINQSSVPVIAVPGTYKDEKLTSLLYASDLTALKPELLKVAAVASLFSASVDLLHISYPSEPALDPDILQSAIQTITDQPVTVHLKPADLSKTLIETIDDEIKRQKPSLVILFTTQGQGFFHQLFLPGNAVSYSFLTTVPLLVFAKA